VGGRGGKNLGGGGRRGRRRRLLVLGLLLWSLVMLAWLRTAIVGIGGFVALVVIRCFRPSSDTDYYPVTS